MTSWRRALAYLLTQACLLALPGVPCVVLIVQAAAAKCHTCGHEPDAAMRAATTTCCAPQPDETATTPRRGHDVVLPPAPRLALATAAFVPVAGSASGALLDTFRAPLVLRL